MKAREIKLIIILSLLLTIIICILLISNTYDFGLVKLYIKSNNDFSAFVTGNHNKIMSDLANSISFDSYTEKRDTILKTTGEISDYKITNVFKNFKNDKDKIIVSYEIKSKLLPEWTDIYMAYGLEGDSWKLFSIVVQGLETTPVSSGVAAEGSEDGLQTIADKVVNAYINDNYNYIYSIMSDDLKKIKKMSDLESYLGYAKEKYGQIRNDSDPIVEPSKTGDEYKFTYLVEAEKYKKISLIIWVKTDENPHLSGIKFTENAW